MNGDFEIVGNIEQIELIAFGGEIRELNRLQQQFGGQRWRKMKGVATVKFLDGQSRTAEVHWYESHGVGKVKMKIKTILDGESE